jgi:hypothetical protein
MMRRFIVSTLHITLLTVKWVKGTCSTNRVLRNSYTVLVNLRGRDDLKTEA